MYGLVLLIILFNSIIFVRDYGRRNFQVDLLLDIRKTIDEGISRSDVEEKMVYVLGQYREDGGLSIVDTFRELMPGRLDENGVYRADFDVSKDGKMEPDETDNINYFYKIDEAQDELKVIVVTEVSLGEDPGYENYDGGKGQFEMLFTLNKMGVSYEVLN
jgi:hypothetical protein